jgi:predicted TIM-barrel fold metal-dependent hydrolase
VSAHPPTAPVIDVDAHFEPAADWLDEFPALQAELPELLPDTDPRFRMDTGEMFAYFVSDDLLRNVPREQRMPIEQLTTPVMQLMFDPNRPEGVGYPGSDQFQPMTDPAARVAWMDSIGIDVQHVISGAGYTLARAIEDPVLGRRALEAVNTWMTDAAADHVDRLRPVTSLRFDDLDWVVAELTRMRERGSRAFLVSAEPAGGIPPMHPDFDKVWSAATDLGMIAHLHVGMNPGLFHPAWANTDDPAIIRLISLQNPHHSAQVFLTAVVFGGVFERHPDLTVLVSELGIDWFPGWVDKVDGMAAPGVSPLVVGDYRWPLTPREYVERNVRISPIPAVHESPRALMEQVPGVAVFSSDYPHYEGNPDPLAHYAHELADADDTTRSRFLGGAVVEAYDRMGDPV